MFNLDDVCESIGEIARGVFSKSLHNAMSMIQLNDSEIALVVNNDSYSLFSCSRTLVFNTVTKTLIERN